MTEWAVNHPLYAPFDELLETPGTIPLKTVEPWCHAAQKQAKDWSPEMLYVTGRAMIEHFPYAVLDSQLAAFDGSHEATDDLCHSRRLIMIGRDCLSLAIPGMRKNPRYRDIYTATNELGNLVDGEPVRTHALKAAIWNISNLQFSDADLSPKRSVVRAVRRAVQRSAPVLPGSNVARQYDSAEHYHEGRRQLRRVVHGAMAAAICDPTGKRQRLAVQGVALNKATGAKKNKLYRALSRPVVEKSL